MLSRAHIVIALEPPSGGPVIRVAGPLLAGAVGFVRQAIQRAALVAGPQVRVDLHACSYLHPAVITCLMVQAERLRAQGGALICEGAAYPATTPAADHTGADHTGADHTGADHTGADHTGADHTEVVRDGYAAGGEDTCEVDTWPEFLSPQELHRQTHACLRWRMEADAAADREYAGRLLRALLAETNRRSDLPKLVPRSSTGRIRGISL